MTENNPTNSADLKELTLTETVERLSAVNYSYADMAIYLGMKKSAFLQEATKIDSPIWTAIQRGRLKTQFVIDEKQALNAESGNITAAQIYKKSYDEAEFKRLKEFVYGGNV